MISRTLAVAALGLLTACGGSDVPDSNPNAGAGVGFGGYDSYSSERAARDQALEARARASAIPEERAIAQETMGVLNRTSIGGTTVAASQLPPSQPISAVPVNAAPIAAAPATTSNPGISDEQSFDAVASRETIESDRERLARQRQVFEVVQPEAVPERPGGTGANIVTYALSSTNRVGEKVYSRSNGYSESRYQRACAKYGSSDQAQVAFLESGGPERDRHGLDPDGDGFACYWDPTPFRSARQ